MAEEDKKLAVELEGPRKDFWSGAGKATTRGKTFWLDIETTGLGQQVTDLGPTRFTDVIKSLADKTQIDKVNTFKALPEYKFFKDIGLAQFVTVSKGRGGAPTWHHAAGYTMWEDSIHDTLMSKRVELSNFSRIKGIGQRTIAAGLKNEASTMPQMLKAFSRKLIEHTSKGTSTVRGWNVWFDVWATQAFMAKHAEDLGRAGLDPFGLVNAIGSGRLRVESMEEHYFDLLAWRGLGDTEWSKKNLRFGRMYAAKLGENAGSPIPIHDYIARRKAGLPNLLRGRSGWKAEKLENIFNQYGDIDKGLKSWKMPGGTSFDAWSTHDAVRDVATEYELSRKFRRINRALQVLERRPAQYGGAFVGVAQDQVLSALAFARSGVLGQQFTGKGMRGSEWNRMVAKSGVSKEILRRAGTIWGAIEAQTPSDTPYIPRAGAYRRIQSPYGEYFRLLWNRDISGLADANVIERLQKDASKKFTQATGVWSRMSGGGKFALASAAAFLAYTAFGQQQDTIDSNLPYDYIPGQHASSKAVDVPWSSPWEGIATDDRSAVEMLAKSALVAGGGYAFYNLPGLVGKYKPDWAKKLIYGAHFAEDIMPFRIGRMFNVGSFWSSFSTPDNYSIRLEHLVGEGVITDAGRAYAGAMNMSPKDFVQVINAKKARGVDHFDHTRIKANSPFMRIDMDDMGKFDIRMFDSTSRLGNSFGAMGSDSFQMRNLSSTQKAKRAAHILQDVIPIGEMGLGRRMVRGLQRLFPNQVGAAVDRWAAIPTWDTNAFRQLQRSQAIGGQHLFVPGYGRGRAGLARAATGVARDATLAGYGALRQAASIVGVKMSGARSVGDMTKGSIKMGAKLTAVIMGFSLLNNSLGGALTDPFYNVWERLMLARASFSDVTGLTGLREQMPDIQTTAIFGVTGAAAGVALMYKYGVRVRSLAADRLGASRASDYGSTVWGVNKRGFGIDVREEAYKLAKTRGSQGIKDFFFRPELAEEWGEMLSAKQYMKWSSLRGRGKIAVTAIAAVSALVAPFLLGSKNTRQELEEIYSGQRNVEIKRGRWWELGATPYEGGRTHYFRRHQIARRKLKAENQVPGEGHTGIWGLIKSIRDPYWRERESYYDRPYPVTGGTFLRELPLIGPVADAIVGGFIKPRRYMHRDMWSAGEDYEQYGGGLAPNAGLGGTASPTPRDPTGLAAQVREFTYRTTELMGLRGYLTQALGFQKIFGGDMPFDQARVLQPARMGPGITNSFWEADLGGMAGLNELYRRLYPRPERGTEVNPLRNRMPSWMPGTNYFVNFREGDPYGKVNYGAERLPGAGYEALHPEMAGVHPEDYTAFHKYNILADVAPWSAEARTARGAAYAQAKGQPARLEALDRIDREVEIIKRKKDFKEYSFLANRETVRGTVSRVDISGRISLAEYPHHTFTMAGLNMGSSAVADQLRRHSSMTKDAATQRASEAAYDRQAKLEDIMLGNTVSISINEGGMNVPEVAGTFSRHGMNINRYLVDQGLAGSEGGAPTAGMFTRLYGGIMEAIGHAPQKIPGPWMSMTKFFNQADPMEEYRRDVLYGSNNRFWDSPYENFLRPYFHQTVSKLTPGEYIPSHVEEQREMDVYLDRIKFLKYAQGGELGRARRTMAGGDMYGNADMIQSALPHREKPFFESFRQETDLRARSRILSMVSQDMQRALTGQWTKDYAATQGRTVAPGNDIAGAVQMAQAQLKGLGRPVPPQGWAGSDPAIDWEDIKAVLVQNEGMDTHDYNIWDDRTQSLLRKPYVYGAVAGLTSRRMNVNINAMSADLARNLGEDMMPFETINHSANVSFTMNNNVNYSAWENEQYARNIGGFR